MIATDWVTPSVMVAAAVILAAMFVITMKARRAKDTAADQVRDLEAKRDALVQRLREVDLPADEKRRLETETATVLRQLDKLRGKRAAAGAAPAAAGTATPTPAAAAPDRYAAVKGFAWGGGSVLVLVGIGWWAIQKAQPRDETMPNQSAPMSASRAQSADPELQQIEAAVAQKPDDLALRDQLALAYFERQNMRGMFEQTQYVLQRSPNDPAALTYQSFAYMANGQEDVAAAMLQRAIKTDPRFVDAYVALAWAQVKSGKEKAAEATIKEAQKQHPEEQQRLASVFVKMKEQAKRLPPNHPPIETAGEQLPPGHPAINDSTPAAAAAVHVTLALGAGVTPPPQGVIYVIARAAGVTAGPPAAVKRMPLSNFPLTFDVSSADSMMGQPLPSKIHLEARIDSDGDAMTRNPKDPMASADNVATGSTTTLTLH